MESVTYDPNTPFSIYSPKHDLICVCTIFPRVIWPGVPGYKKDRWADGRSSTVTWQLPHHDRLQGDQRVSNLDFANVIYGAVSEIPKCPVLISVLLLAGMVNCNEAVDVTVVHLTLRRSY